MAMNLTRYYGLVDELFKLINPIRDNVLREFIHYVISRYNDEYLTSPAARKCHHAYEGGLLEHSVATAKAGSKIADHFMEFYGTKINKSLLITGLLLHDIGKIKCYKWVIWKQNGEVQAGYQHTQDNELLNHITIGMMLISDLAKEFNASREKIEHELDDAKLRKLTHIIISHHGRKAWGSPVTPKTVEAYIAHMMDMLDAGVVKIQNTGVAFDYEH